MPRIIDLSLPLSSATPVWPGDPPIRLHRPYQLAQGDAFSLTELRMSAHAGTHVDAPAHYLPDGVGVDALPLDALVGPAIVIAIPAHCSAITAEVLSELAIPRGSQRVLFRTMNSARRLLDDAAFHTDFVALAEDGARWLVERGVRLVGVDYFSVAPYEALAATHRVLLQAGIVIVEGLNLAEVAPGDYTFICLPLKLKGADGAPARAILLTADE